MCDTCNCEPKEVKKCDCGSDECDCNEPGCKPESCVDCKGCGQ